VKLPFEWDYIKIVESKDYSLTEQLLHDKFSDKRVNGEWFDLSDEDISDIENEKFDEVILQSISGEGDLYA
ncbi:GIY-YIG nuclease family protein, partial [Cytobacillus sp. FSL K6-0129]|uniref:GIY-YIG nuclease family protein n=1 Tax=Cytobacillus sp. FSL K6-0129 TaxID=2921421 RepID=UPI0030FA9835